MGCSFPKAASVYLTTAVDTTEKDMSTFYTYDTTVTYMGRLYYVANQTLYTNDLLNGIDSIVVTDLSALYVSSPAWTEGDEYLQIYNVQRSKISGQYLALTTDFESLNDPGFTPKIFVGETGFPASIMSVEALSYPNNANPASDVQKILTGAAFNRFFFRGIDPKIRKQ